jgi:NitT/TauT family transport system substrate-binding protein
MSSTIFLDSPRPLDDSVGVKGVPPVEIYRMKRILGVASGLLLYSTALSFAADAIPTTPEPGTIKIGVEPWLGYGPWHIAAAKGFFKKHGLDDVQFVNFTEDKDMDAAVVGGQLDLASVPTHGALNILQTGTPLKAVLLLDFSLKADAIASKDVTSVKDFKGKSIAYEEGSTSDVLLNYALAQNGMSIADIKRVPMPAAQAGSALVAGQVPVTVTYEPYLSVAMGQDKGVKLVYTAGEDPGLISDVLIATGPMLEKKPGAIVALIEAWDDGLAYYRANVEDGRAIIAKAVGSSPDELKTAFEGVQFYSLAENKDHLAGDFANKTLKDVEKAALAAKILQQDVPTDSVVDARFVEAAGK